MGDTVFQVYTLDTVYMGVSGTHYDFLINGINYAVINENSWKLIKTNENVDESQMKHKFWS